MGKFARRTAEEEYSANRHFESIMNLYNRILG
jgi:hypothetical protein